MVRIFMQHSGVQSRGEDSRLGGSGCGSEIRMDDEPSENKVMQVMTRIDPTVRLHDNRYHRAFTNPKTG